MADLKLSQEFGLDDGIMVLEPANKCACSCSFCYVELNRQVQWSGKTRKYEDPGTFESTVERAFGPDYDPTDLLQWGLHNRLVTTYSAGVEPFQNSLVARSILGVARDLRLPLFVQTRGLAWRKVWPEVVKLAGNVEFYVSLPTLDQSVLDTFEPGTPPASDRRALIEACASAGIPVTLAIAPAHVEWSDPGGLAAMAAVGLDWGATTVFVDCLHLNPRQRGAIRSRRNLPDDSATSAIQTDEERLACSAWSPDFVSQCFDVMDLCIARGAGFSMVDGRAIAEGLVDLPKPDSFPFRYGRRWPYVDANFLEVLEDGFDGDGDPGPAGEAPIALTWGDALALMHGSAPEITQPFRYSTIRGVIRRLKSLPPGINDSLGESATLPEIFRAIWRDPTHRNGFAWRHPFVRVAVKPAGAGGRRVVPWVDDEGDPYLIFDPDWAGRSAIREIEDIESCRFLVTEPEPEPEPEPSEV